MDDRLETDRAGGGIRRTILIAGSPGVDRTTLIAFIVDRLPGTKTGFSRKHRLTKAGRRLNQPDVRTGRSGENRRCRPL